MFKNRQRIDAAFAKGLMFGKAVGARDERDLVIRYLQSRVSDLLECHKKDNCDEVAYVIENCIDDIRELKNER